MCVKYGTVGMGYCETFARKVILIQAVMPKTFLKVKI